MLMLYWAHGQEKDTIEAKTLMCCVSIIIITLPMITINQNIVYNLCHMAWRSSIHFHYS